MYIVYNSNNYFVHVYKMCTAYLHVHLIDIDINVWILVTCSVK